MKHVSRKDVWEHPIPVKYSKDILVSYIKNGNRSKINNYIAFVWDNTYQVFLEEKWDNELKKHGLQEKMPKGWCWDAPGTNVFQRYVDAGIPEKEYL